MTPFGGVPQRACEGGPLYTQHNLHHTGHTCQDTCQDTCPGPNSSSVTYQPRASCSKGELRYSLDK